MGAEDYGIMEQWIGSDIQLLGKYSSPLLDDQMAQNPALESVQNWISAFAKIGSRSEVVWGSGGRDKGQEMFKILFWQ